VGFQRHPARPADALAMLLQAGRYAKLIGNVVFAKPVRIATAGSILSRLVRPELVVVLRPCAARDSKESNDDTNTAQHVGFPSKPTNRVPEPVNIQRNAAIMRLDR
jgi:hypothetical protein